MAWRAPIPVSRKDGESCPLRAVHLSRHTWSGFRGSGLRMAWRAPMPRVSLAAFSASSREIPAGNSIAYSHAPVSRARARKRAKVDRFVPRVQVVNLASARQFPRYPCRKPRALRVGPNTSLEFEAFLVWQSFFELKVAVKRFRATLNWE